MNGLYNSFIKKLSENKHAKLLVNDKNNEDQKVIDNNYFEK